MHPDPTHYTTDAFTTRHARVRCQQRGIPRDLIRLLLDFGCEQHVGHGATMLSFPKQRRIRLKQTMSRVQFASLSSHLAVYAIVGPMGKVMTVGHRYKPVREKH